MKALKIARPKTAFTLDPSEKAQKRIRDDRHLAFIRTLPSVLTGRMGCEACHLRAGNPTYRKKRTGKGQKPDDAWTLPLTPDEHREQHTMNELTFYRRHGLHDPWMLCQQLYAVSGDYEAAVKVLKGARRI